MISMFQFICKKLFLFQKRDLLNRHSTPSSSSILAFLQTIKTTTTSRSISTTPHDNSFTVSYLINSCGLSQQEALSASKLFQFKTSSNPDSVLTLLKNYGFTNIHISKFVLKSPSLLLAKPDKTLQPKLEFFRSIGFSDPIDLANTLCKDPNILQRSLENQIIPSYDFLKTIVHTNANVIRIIKDSTWVLKEDPQKRIAPNIAILRAHGVPHSNIATLLIKDPTTFLIISDQFSNVADEVKEMGFDPLKSAFLLAVCALIRMKKSLWIAKMEVYRRWGWSELEFMKAFRNQPNCMMISEKKITRIMDFLVNRMGFDPSVIAQSPNVMLLSLEKRIIPRSSVLHILISKGLVKKDFRLNPVFGMPDNCFLEKYVTKFKDEVPELLNVYQGNANDL